MNRYCFIILACLLATRVAIAGDAPEPANPDHEIRYLKATIELLRKKIAQQEKEITHLKAELERARTGASTQPTDSEPTQGPTSRPAPGPTSRPKTVMELPPKIVAYVEDAIKEKAHRLWQCEVLLKEFQPTKPGGHRDVRNRKIDRRRIAELSKKLRWLRQATPGIDIIPKFKKFKVGKIGIPNFDKYTTVGQIRSKDEMLLNFTWYESYSNMEYPKRTNVTVLAKGFSTEGLADGEMFQWPGPVEITGTKKYKTVMGSGRTIYVVKAFHFDIMRYLPALKKRFPKEFLRYRPNKERTSTPLGMEDN